MNEMEKIDKEVIKNITPTKKEYYELNKTINRIKNLITH